MENQQEKSPAGAGLLDEEYVSSKEICDVLKIHKTTLWRKVKRGEFPQPMKIGKTHRWSVSELKQFFLDQDIKINHKCKPEFQAQAHHIVRLENQINQIRELLSVHQANPPKLQELVSGLPSETVEAMLKPHRRFVARRLAKQDRRKGNKLARSREYQIPATFVVAHWSQVEALYAAYGAVRQPLDVGDYLNQTQSYKESLKY